GSTPPAHGRPAAEVAAAGRAGAGSPPNPSTASGIADTLGAIFFVVDLPSLDTTDKLRFTQVWEELVEDTETLNLPRATYVIGRTGRLEEITPLSSEAADLRRAAEKIRSLPHGNRSVRKQILGLSTASPKSAEAEARAEGSRERLRTIETLELLAGFCEALAGRPGRTALVWISSGFHVYQMGPWQFFYPDRSRGAAGLDTPDLAILQLQDKLHRAANSANVSIYSVDPMRQRAISAFDAQMTGTAGLGGQGPGQNAVVKAIRSRGMRIALDNRRDGLRRAAEETGRKAFIGWADLGEVLLEIEADTSEFYLLTYEPPPPHGDGEFHEIGVEVRRPDVSIRARKGYVDLAPEDRRLRAVEAALALPGSVTDLPLRARAFRKWSASGEPVVQVAFAIDRDALAWVKSQAGYVSTEVGLHLVVLNEDDDAVENVDEWIRQDAPASDAGRPLSGRPLVLTEDWSLEPGTYEVRLVLEDRQGGRLGATRLEVEVPERDRGPSWQTSDLILMASDGSEEPRPVVDDRVANDDVTLAYLEVRGGQEPTLSGQILDAEGNRKLVELNGVRLGADSSRIHRGGIFLPSLEPGRYILQVVLSDRPAGQYQVFRTPLQVTRSPGTAATRSERARGSS
ncbi:MAG: VWA domain-containing protein, partial [Acidobacteriota bacterium]